MNTFREILPSITRDEWKDICKDLTDEDLLNLVKLSYGDIKFILIRIGLVEWRRRIRSFTLEQCSKLILLIRQDNIVMRLIAKYEYSLLNNSPIHNNYHEVYYIYLDTKGRIRELREKLTGKYTR